MTKSTGDVFRDLGFSHAESQNLRVRSELMLRLRHFIRENNLTQTVAARKLGVTQPRVSNLMRGHIHEFTIDMLVNMLAKAGVVTHIVEDRRHEHRLPEFPLQFVERQFADEWHELTLAGQRIAQSYAKAYRRANEQSNGEQEDSTAYDRQYALAC